MIAPNPRPSRATDSDRPRARLDRKTLSTEPTSRPMYAAMNPQPAMNASRKQNATIFSAFLACEG